MKKIFFPIFILTYIVIIAGIWIFQTNETLGSQDEQFAEFYFVAVIIFLFILGIINSYKRFRNRKEGYPEEDEMSRKITRKSASYSFYASVFLWLALLYINSRGVIDPALLFGYGILGMALIFSIIWTFINFKGVSNGY